MEEFDKTSLELRKAMQQVEDLKAQIDHKHSSERWVGSIFQMVCMYSAVKMNVDKGCVSLGLNHATFDQIVWLDESGSFKMYIYRKLSEENRRLSCTVEREVNEKKRLSMENEELHWKIRQSTDTVMSLSTIEGMYSKEAKKKSSVVTPHPCQSISSVSSPLVTYMVFHEDNHRKSS